MTRLIAIYLATLSGTLGPQATPQQPISGDREVPAPTAPLLPPAPDTLNDGPHIYWETDQTAIVFYHCDRISNQPAVRFETRNDTLRFQGRCDDRSIEYVVPRADPVVKAHIIDDVPRIFAVSDIHGEYEAFANILLHAGIVDEDLHWRWGSGHLVVLGDVFDRGDMVTECLWLIYRLEQEAARVGGQVHYTLGNHELMALQGDLRYVNPKYLAGIAGSGVSYSDLYGPGMEMGRWIRSKHVAIKLNDIVFVHGGLSQEAVERDLSLGELNIMAREGIDLRSYDIIFNQSWNFLFDASGPFWFRGYHGDMNGWYDRVSHRELNRILEFYEASAIVVGHTDIGTLESLYDGRVFGIDVSLESLGSFQGLLWEDGVFYRVSGTGMREPLVEMR
jgi:hypothetical protein